MWKKTLLALFLMSNYAWSNSVTTEETIKSYTETELKKLKNDWLQIYQKELQYSEQMRITQRKNFQQAINLIDTAVSQKKLSSQAEQIIRGLLSTLSGYPLEMEADWALLNAKHKLKQSEDGDIQAFMAKYPNSLYKQRLQQFMFEQLYSEQKFTELVDYAKMSKPANITDKCRLFSARYEIAANKEQINPEVIQTAEQKNENIELELLVKEFDEFWLATPKLTSDCANLESYWRDRGLKTDKKIRLKAVELVKQNANAEISNLVKNETDENLKNWLNEISLTVSNPKQLQTFVENQPLESPFKVENKEIILKLFPEYVLTLSEDLENPTFEQYQSWAEKYELTVDELKAWKIAFINRLFDNKETTFQLWRDKQIKELKMDNLTERRLRVAIGQKADLNEWLELLSNDARNKAEWRYWSAKKVKNEAKRRTILGELAKERGFYSMLAAQELNIAYQLPTTEMSELTQEQFDLYSNQFERIKEFRELGRFDQARTAWISLIKSVVQDVTTTVPTKTQIAIIKYAKDQNWYDLAVEGTIQAKAFNNIELRLPNAYSDWFDLNLKDKKISKTFAQAIARQESAWNAEARSHANARGLMQMLPSTAQKTANDNELPYEGEGDLFKPFNNIMLGTAHLAELNEKYPNNRILVAAAYNAGVGRVQQWINRGEQKLAMDEFIATIPFYETRGYVQNVLAYDYYYQTIYGVSTKSTSKLKMFYKEELEQKY